MRAVGSKFFLICHCVVAVAGLTMKSVRAEVAVVVSSNSSLANLTPSEVTEIFLRSSAELPSGRTLVPVDQMEGSGIRNEFYEKVARKNATQLRAYWARRVFTGKGEPPRELPDANAVKRWVASNPYAVGYIDLAQADSTVKIVLMLR
ncbi:phosphate ABC transporter substrate-binding protein [Noviherbaspirillum saxi]|uniref:Phosphate ABC transporter substrate-binding protein n=2 Tax=Noviherbaspirillum saxi TaxID=2320863 RepID=A0A3A3FER7_9BURK|nr:phosphate ABC transporter substrate-binding protein [Noviherbaspirillum saxi]